MKRPVISGHETNDPVKYLFPLSAKESNEHVELLSKLAELLSQKEFIQFLEKVSSTQEFINYFGKE